MSELVAALVGAIFGGAVSWIQTGRVLRHEAQRAHEAAADERRATREGVAQTLPLNC